jgi:hypothetical protein
VKPSALERGLQPLVDLVAAHAAEIVALVERLLGVLAVVRRGRRPAVHLAATTSDVRGWKRSRQTAV